MVADDLYVGTVCQPTSGTVLSCSVSMVFERSGLIMQTKYGKLSDIYGRRKCLIFCWTIFGFGCFIV